MSLFRHSWTPEYRASAAAIRHFIREAVEHKRWGMSMPADWQASDMSLKMAEEARTESVHAIARGMLDYLRMRARIEVDSPGRYNKPDLRKWKAVQS